MSVARHWRGWPEIRDDLRAGAALVLLLAAAGLLAGLLWWWLAPRADFRITDSGPVAVGRPSDELFVADDSVFALVLTCFGLVSGAIAWFLRRRRGVAMVLALAVGGSLMAVVAWQLGELLGAGPTEAELAQVGGVVTTALRLVSLPALAAAPFAALVAYLVGVLYVSSDDLHRAGEPTTTPPPPEPAAGTDSERSALLDAPPPGGQSG